MTAEDHVAEEDARALLECSAKFVELTVARRAVEERVVLLARRITRDWKLTDEEAIQAAGKIAVHRLLPGGSGSHGR